MSPSKDQSKQAPSLVEELAALLRDFIPTATMSERAARAILSAIAGKGVDGMPSVADAWKAYDGQYNEHSGIIAVERMYRLALGPILAAKDAERHAMAAILGQIIVAASLVPGEKLADPIEHAAVAAMLGMVEQRNVVAAERDALRVCVAELEALLHKLLDVDERGNGGPLAMRERAFVEIGDVVVEARSLLGRPLVPGPLASCAKKGSDQ